MTIFLEGYTLGARMCIVARSDETKAVLIDRGAEIFRIKEDSIVFLPDNAELKVSEKLKNRLSLLSDYDIVEIDELGLLYRAFADKEPDSMVFMGGRCNSNCIMCPASDAERRKGFAYSREKLLKYIGYLPCDLENLVITGGEPTMSPQLFLEALSAVTDKFPHTDVLLLTNGRSLSDRSFFEKINEKHPRKFTIAVPIHGSSSELHDSITRAEGSFEQTALGLRRLMNSNINVELRIVVTKANSEYLTEIAEYISQNFKRVKCVNFIGLEPRGNCVSNFESVYIDHRTAFLKSRDAIVHLMSKGYDVGLYNFPLCAVDRGFWTIASKSISHYKNVYHEDCEKCGAKMICGGFFRATLDFVHPQVYPITAGESENE